MVAKNHGYTIFHGKTVPTLNPFPGSRVYYLSNSSDGTSNKGWRTRLKAGVQAGSPYYSSKVRIQYLNEGSARNTETFKDVNGNVAGKVAEVYSGLLTESLVSFPAYTASVSSSMESEVLTSLYRKIKAESETTNSLIFLGELRETLHMLRNPANAIETAFKKLVKAHTRNSKGATRHVTRRRGESDKRLWERRATYVKDATAGSWLEFQFGVKPLVQDVKDITAAAKNVALGRANKARLSATSTEARVAVPAIMTHVSGGFNLSIRSTDFRWGTASLRYVVGMQRSSSGGFPETTAVDEFGLNIANFVPTIYELLPWSFLLDYFTNIGDIIGAAFTSTARVTWVVRTVRLTSDQGHDFLCVQPSPLGGGWETTDFGGDLGQYRVTGTVISRSVPDRLELPSIELSYPGQNSNKWYNMAALASSFHKPK